MIRILHISPHDEDDGIAKYQEQYLAGMADLDTVENKFFDVSPLNLRFLSPPERAKTLERLQEELHGYDIVHIQHEFGLYHDEEFRDVVLAARATHKKIIITVHLSPGFAIRPVKLGGLGPRSWMVYLRRWRHRRRMVQRHIVPMLLADRLIVHNTVTADALKQFGARDERIVKIPHPVPKIDQPAPSKFISERLNKKASDVIYCLVGMMHRYKGVYDAIKALNFLPDNYKLAIIGGVHALSEDVHLYNRACDLIDQLGLNDRVYITGFVKDDSLMNAYIQECDACVFPYDGKYYAHLSSGSINLALANAKPVIAYPTAAFKELSAQSNGAVVLCGTYAYYELARELERINADKQVKLARAYATKVSWPKMAHVLAELYHQVV